MSNDSLFRRNLLIIAGLHILVIAALFLSGFFSKHEDNVMLVEGGGSPGAQAPALNDNTGSESTPDENTPAPNPRETPGNARTPPPSMIVLPTATPLIAAVHIPRPAPTPTPQKPTPTPTPKSPSPSPRHSPTPKKKIPSPSPKSSPKKSASPKPGTPKPSSSPSASATPKPSPGEGENNAENPQVASGTTGTTATSGTSSSRSKAGAHPGDGSGPGRQGDGAAKTNQIGWYLTMIKDRFYSHWQRPVIDVPDGQNLSAIVKIRIEKDGHISQVSLEKSSGNALMDESAMTAAKSVTQIDPLPAAIEDSFYDVPIEFKLTPD